MTADFLIYVKVRTGGNTKINSVYRARGGGVKKGLKKRVKKVFRRGWQDIFWRKYGNISYAQIMKLFFLFVLNQTRFAF